MEERRGTHVEVKEAGRSECQRLTVTSRGDVEVEVIKIGMESNREGRCDERKAKRTGGKIVISCIGSERSCVAAVSKAFSAFCSWINDWICRKCSPLFTACCHNHWF